MSHLKQTLPKIPQGVVSRFFPFYMILFFLLANTVFPAGLPLSVAYEVGGVEYDQEIPRIEDFTGAILGQRHSTPYQIIEYFRAVAEASDRVSLVEYGRTYEGVPLTCAVVTSPDNQGNLDTIRQNNLMISEHPGSVNEKVMGRMPLVVYVGAGIHGNEASGGEASMLLLYHLAAGKGHDMQKLLSNLVVLIDPMINPDGRSRFTKWVNANRGKVPTADLFDREHNEPWPGGRTNHYWFDMNRDLLPAALQETSHRLSLYHSWRPQLVTDHHEQGSRATFFFQPGIPSGNNPNTPRATVNLTGKIGEFHARELDRIGSLYFSEEVYDDFYYGKGSTYPDINGAVGILFEQASSRSLVTQGADGELDYSFTIRNQFATMISTLEAGLALRTELLKNQWDFYRSIEEFARQSSVKGYVFSMPEDRSIAEMFISLLHKHKIKVYRLTSNLKKDGIRFGTDNSWIVPLNQGQGRLVKTIFEEVTEFGDVVFYDVSSWTLPHAFGLEFRGLDSLPDKLIGSEVVAGDLSVKGSVQGGEASYAYVFRWNLWSAAVVYRLLDRGISARIINTEVEIDTTSGKVGFNGPSVIVPVKQKNLSSEEIHQSIREVIRDFPVEVYATGSGISVEGPYLGSSQARPLRKPVVALITGQGISSREAGEAWFVLDEKMEIPVSLINQDVFARLDFSSYNCLILPSGSYREWQEPQIEALKKWVAKGGTLIAIRSAVNWAIKSGIIDEEMVEDKQPALDLPYGELSKARRGQRISGAIFNTRIDNSHPLSFGIRQDLPVFRNHTDKLKPSRNPGSNIALYSSDPLLSGYLPKSQKGKLDRTASVIARRSGSGSVILFLDNPVFRGHWWGTARLFLNSVFFGNLF